jgi:RHS repeat-associated protein
MLTSSLSSNSLLGSVLYPDALDSGDRVSYAYNRQGQVTGMRDPNGTEHEYRYDKLGRRTADVVTVLGAGVDGAVRRIETAYDVRGLVSLVTSYDAPTGGSVVNQVRFAYDDFGQLTNEYQSHAGAVTVGTTPKVQYAYADGSDNTVRPTTVTYPTTSRALTYDYGAGDDDRLSRVAAIKEGTDSRAAYTYYGLSTFCKTNYIEPATAFDLAYGGGGTDPYGGCLDRFSRMIQAPWVKSGSPKAGATYQYDRASNRTQMQPLGYAAIDDDLQRYSYDGVNRLTRSIRGPENGLKGQESWQLDATGNWRNYDRLSVDDPTENLAQQRTANRANEITGIARSYGANWPTPVYDRAGNTVSFPAPLDATEAMSGVYDAWNRLVASDDATYAYDGQNRRTTLTESGSTRHFYYSDQWQILEERLDDDTDADRQFVWGLRYVDDQIFRDIGGTRLYGLQDANWNLVAVTNTSGTIQQRYRYLAYGQPIRLDDDGVVATGTDSILWSFLYGGYRYDRSTGLYQIRFRYLQPGIGAWLTRDPIAYVDGFNAYGYVHNSPLDFLDSAGLLKHASEVVKEVVEETLGGSAAAGEAFPWLVRAGGAIGMVLSHPTETGRGADQLPKREPNTGTKYPPISSRPPRKKPEKDPCKSSILLSEYPRCENAYSFIPSVGDDARTACNNCNTCRVQPGKPIPSLDDVGDCAGGDVTISYAHHIACKEGGHHKTSVFSCTCCSSLSGTAEKQTLYKCGETNYGN